MSGASAATFRWRDASLRFSVAGHGLMAVWKLGAAVPTLSWVLLASAGVNIGVATAKTVALRAGTENRRRELSNPAATDARRLIGAIILATAVVYAAASALMPTYDAEFTRHHEIVAIAIATLAFAELGICTAGLVRRRRESGALDGAIRATNLMGALALLVLAQSALLNMAAPDTDHTAATALTGALAGIVGAAVGCRVLLTARAERSTAPAPAAPSIAVSETTSTTPALTKELSRAHPTV